DAAPEEGLRSRSRPMRPPRDGGFARAQLGRTRRRCYERCFAFGRTAMIQFYFASGSPWAWRVYLALEEKDLPNETTLLSFSAGDLKKPDYLAMNPHGKVPVLKDGAVTLYESQAIL